MRWLMDEPWDRFLQDALVADLVRVTVGRVLADTTFDQLFDRVA